jgi:uncharacterized membrane protein (Fun14 family)
MSTAAAVGAGAAVGAAAGYAAGKAKDIVRRLYSEWE